MAKHKPQVACVSFQWPRSDPAQLQAFDATTKVCTMTCGPAAGDPRSPEERKFQCDDCLTVENKMKHFITMAVPATTKLVLDRVSCDICGVDIVPKVGFDLDHVTLKHEKGTYSPEGGSGECATVDICPSCFQGRMVPWLQSLGVHVQYTPVEV